jgi:hypothetical protein
MARIFLSYDRDDADRARPIALALEKSGHSVWWDPHIKAGEQYTKVIDEARQAADAVVVLWSAHSIESTWVRDEAAVGTRQGASGPNPHRLRFRRRSDSGNFKTSTCRDGGVAAVRDSGTNSPMLSRRSPERNRRRGSKAPGVSGFRFRGSSRA